MLVNLDLLKEPPTEDSYASALGTPISPMAGCFAPDNPRVLIDQVLPGYDVHFCTGGRWSMYDMLSAIVEMIGPCALWVSTFSITEFSARQLIRHMEAGEITELHILLDYRAKVRYPEVYQLAQYNATSIRLTPCHAKVMVAEGANSAIALNGSANWTENPRLEAGVLSSSPAVVAFYKKFIQKSLANGHPFD